MKNLPTKKCTGCSACVEKCPKQCISMISDKEGFLYPQIDNDRCIHCNLCEKVCPVLGEYENRKPIQIYIGYNLNSEILFQSSSGGIFTLLAERIIQEGGIVFGARFNDNWEVVHDYVESFKDLPLLRGSKYVQSSIEGSYSKAKFFLKLGKKVLFSGTPCQIAGLKRFLNTEYENLLTIDFICHGVPSPGVWGRYLQDFIVNHKLDINANKCSITDIFFRKKTFGWKNFSLSISSSSNLNDDIISIQEPLNKNDYLKGFIHNLYLRPCCHDCHVKSWKSGSDINLADAWGIWNYYPELDNDRGCSIVTLLSSKGEKYFELIKESGKFIMGSEDFILKHNSAAYHSAKPHKNRKKFFKLLVDSQYTFSEIIHKCLPPTTYMEKVMWSINKRIKKYAKR